jgi:hypothetical protein
MSSEVERGTWASTQTHMPTPTEIPLNLGGEAQDHSVVVIAVFFFVANAWLLLVDIAAFFFAAHA